MKSHNISTSNLLLKNIDKSIPMSVTLTNPTKVVETLKKSSATTPCRDPLEAVSTARKSFVLERLYLLKKSIQEIKDPDHETTNSSYVSLYYSVTF